MNKLLEISKKMFGKDASSSTTSIIIVLIFFFKNELVDLVPESVLVGFITISINTLFNTSKDGLKEKDTLIESLKRTIFLYGHSLITEEAKSMIKEQKTESNLIIEQILHANSQNEVKNNGDNQEKENN